MGNKECKYSYSDFCDRKNCKLAETFLHQSELGGNSKPNTSKRFGGQGPYWSKEGWESFAQRTIDSSGNCRERVNLENTVRKVTEAKKAKNELF